jgi:two-component system response regulator PilR (NtrC family)
MNNEKARILIVEDENSMRDVLSMLLEGEGYRVTTAEDGAEGLTRVDGDIFDLIITDIKMPGATGFDILKRAQDVSPETLVIMITAFGTVESGIDAMKQGAFDYINKPFKIDEIRLIVRNAMERQQLKSEVSRLREKVKNSFEVENIIGKSVKMQQLLGVVQKVAQNSSNVLVSGESGTGKELVAAAVHSLSPRKEKNFVAINCAAFPEGLLESEIFGHVKGAFTGAVQNKQGLFEVADEGTLFMDEIGEMSINLQSKLLRAIESGTFRRVGGTTDITVNTRIVSATNRNLEEAVASGIFREDLFFRLNVIPVTIPPLRERKDDIPLLVEHFAAKYSDSPRQFSGSAMKMLMDYGWKGNVRELENIVERILLFAETDIITDADIPDEVRQGAENHKHLPELDEEGINLEEMLAELEKKYLLNALRRTGGKKTDAAKLLGLTFRSFRHKLSKYSL